MTHPIDHASTGEALRKCSTESEAEAFLDSCGLAKSDLQDLTAALGITTLKAATVKQLRTAIIRRTVGMRLQHAAISGIAVTPPSDHTPAVEDAQEDSAWALAHAMMRTILDSGHDPMRIFDDLTDLQERVTAAAKCIGEERACLLTEQRKPGESIAAFTRRVGRLSEARMGDLLRLGQALLEKQN